jgi:GT2 family glycosyltransferase
MAALVSVIIPHLDDLAGLDRCLTALTDQTLPSACIEILVIDNGSHCGLAAVSHCVAGRARLVEQLQRGAGPARNQGVAEAQTDILAFTDADCLPRPDWLAKGVERVGPDNYVGGDIVVTAIDPANPSAAEAYEIAIAFDIERYALKKGFVATANLFVTKSAFLAIGPFDDTLSEDTDWCWRANRAGYRLDFAADVLVEHPARPTIAALDKKNLRITRERFHLAMRWGHSRAAWAFRAIVALLLSPRDFVRFHRVPPRFWLSLVMIHMRLRWHRCVETLRLCWHHDGTSEPRQSGRA